MNKVNLKQKLRLIHTHWGPKIVDELNGQHVRLVKFQGEFVWHKHEVEDELFPAVSGAFDMQFRDGTVTVEEGEFVIVAQGVEHCPKADEEVHVLLFEPAGIVNPGHVGGNRTVTDPGRV